MDLAYATHDETLDCWRSCWDHGSSWAAFVGSRVDATGQGIKKDSLANKSLAILRLLGELSISSHSGTTTAADGPPSVVVLTRWLLSSAASGREPRVPSSTPISHLSHFQWELGAQAWMTICPSMQSGKMYLFFQGHFLVSFPLYLLRQVSRWTQSLLILDSLSSQLVSGIPCLCLLPSAFDWLSCLPNFYVISEDLNTDCIYIFFFQWQITYQPNMYIDMHVYEAFLYLLSFS